MIFTAVKFVVGGLAGIGAGAVATKAFSVLAANVMPETGRFMKVAVALGGVGVGMAVTDVTTKAIEDSVDNVQKTFQNLGVLKSALKKETDSVADTKGTPEND